MTVNLNPDPHAEGFKSQPILHVTAIFDGLDDVISAIQADRRTGGRLACGVYVKTVAMEEFIDPS